MIKRNAFEGFTLIEVIIVLTIFSIVMGTAVSMMASGSDTTKTTILVSKLQQRASFLSSKIAREMLSAEFNSISPQQSAPNSSSTITFQKIVDYDITNDAMVLGNPVTVRMTTINGNRVVVYNDGNPASQIDPDGDGILNAETILSYNVAEFANGELAAAGDDNGNGLAQEAGLSFEIRDQTVVIRITMEDLIDGRLVQETVETAINIRVNDN